MTIYIEHSGFVKNDAYHEYCQIIKNAVARVPQTASRDTAKQILGYCESHHIIPSCLDGSNTRENKAWLTAFEHLKAHLLLVKFSANDYTKHKTSHAAIRMLNKQDHKHERVYEEDLPDEVLEEIALLREESARLHSEYMSELFKGDNNPFKDKHHTEEHKEYMRDLMTGRPKPPESIPNYRASKLGDKNPAKKVVTCPCCGAVGQSGGMRKHHFDYCIEGLTFRLVNDAGEEFVGKREEFAEYLQIAKWFHGKVGTLLRGRSEEFLGWRLLSRITTNTEVL